MAVKEITVSKKPTTSASLTLIRNDRYSQVIRFRMDKKIGGVDLTNYIWSVRVVNAYNETDKEYIGLGTVVGEELIVDWTVGSCATSRKGTTTFELEGVYQEGTGSNAKTCVWQTAKRTITVYEDIDNEPNYEESTVSSLQELFITVGTKLNNMSTTIDTAVSNYNNLNTQFTSLKNTVEQNESTRSSNETARKSAETTRQENESIRIANETARLSSEASRSNNETTRQNKETERINNEISRATSEASRSRNEDSRVSSENTRTANENARIRSEIARISSESTRASNEASRESKEAIRENNEAIRISNETTRENAFQAKQTEINTVIENANTAISNTNTAATNAQNIASTIQSKLNNGELNGKDGEDGTTPVKGVDYFTDSEISNIKTAVETNVFNRTKDLIETSEDINPIYNYDVSIESTFGSVYNNKYEYNAFATSSMISNAMKSCRSLKRVRASDIESITISNGLTFTAKIICYDDDNSLIGVVNYTGSGCLSNGTVWIVPVLSFDNALTSLPIIKMSIKSDSKTPVYSTSNYVKDDNLIRFIFPTQLPVKSYYRKEAQYGEEVEGSADTVYKYWNGYSELSADESFIKENWSGTVTTYTKSDFIEIDRTNNVVISYKVPFNSAVTYAVRVYDSNKNEITTSSAGNSTFYLGSTSSTCVAEQEVTLTTTDISNAKYLRFCFMNNTHSKWSTYTASNNPDDAFFKITYSGGTAYSYYYPAETMPNVNVSNKLVTDCGWIYLPPNYDPLGNTKVPLVLFCHGTGGFNGMTTSTSSGSYHNYLKFVADCGYAVADCFGFTSEYVYDSTYSTAVSANNSRFQPIIASSYTNMVKYLLKSYNLSDDGVYIFGKSNGGQAPLYFGSVQPFKVRAVSSLAGTNSIINSMLYTKATTIKWLMHCFDMDEHEFTMNTADNKYLFETISDDDKTYLINNLDKVVEFDPFCVNSDIDYKAFITACFNHGYRTDMNDDANTRTDCWTIINKAHKFKMAPTKLFQAKDDNEVPAVYAKFFAKMVRNAGGICEYREYNSGLGGHHAVDTSSSAPTVTVTPKYSNTAVTVPAAYAETVEWFNRW